MEPEGHRVFVLMGSNIDPLENMRRGTAMLQQKFDVQAVSMAWETPPVGTSGQDFYNAAFLLSTNYPFEEVKTQLRGIETSLNRVRTEDKYAPRTMDLDIIIFDQRVVEPRLWTLAFIAIPMAELIPELYNSETGESLSQLAQKLIPTSKVTPRPEVFRSLSVRTR